MASSNFVFSYGDYDFSPRPLLSISSQPLKTPDGSGFGVVHDITFDGDIVLKGAGERSSGINGVFQKIERLKSAINKDGCPLVISCDGATPILSGHPTIESYSFNNESDNYTERAGYNIVLKMYTMSGGTSHDYFNNYSGAAPYIETASETWDIEFQDEQTPFVWSIGNGVTEDFGYRAAVTHTVDVKARRAYSGCFGEGSTPWEDAVSYASGMLGFNAKFAQLSGILGLPGSGYNGFNVLNNFRKVNTNKTEGSINIVETFVVTPSGENTLNNVTDTFDINVDQQDGIVSVAIQGTIQGMVENNWSYNGTSAYGGNLQSSKYSNATGYFNNVSGARRMYDRAKRGYSDVFGFGIGPSGQYTYNCTGVERPLNPQPRQKSISVNPIAGTIAYNYTFDTLPSGMFAAVTGGCVISENISIDDQLLTDVFASQTVIGRAAGPILQDIGTTNARVRTISVELVCLTPTNFQDIDALYSTVPTGAVEDFIASVTGNLPSDPSAVFVSQNSQNWNFTTGRYTKTLAVTYNNCS